jgi:single-stranded-DNA-specific exonuclease
MTQPDDFIPRIFIDFVLDFEDISDKLIDELESLKPFGMGNNEPLFMAGNINVVSSTIVGNNHRRMVLSQGKGRTDKTFNSIHFNVDPDTPLKENFDRIAFRLRWNRWNGRKTAQLVIEET